MCFARLWLHTDVELEVPQTVMYPFDTREQMEKFKGFVDSIYNGTYCDDCERGCCDDCEQERDESHE